ncbi:hypothetical protein GCM10027347_58910 [Larkinella harenae]
MAEKGLLSVIERSLASPHGKSPAYVDNRGWSSLIRESFPGAWQHNIEVRRDSVLAFHSVFACITLISSDIAKMRLKLVQEANGIWQEIPKTNYQVLDRPNGYQNRMQFFESWLISKLSRGNTYALKGRDRTGKVTSLYILSPDRVMPLVTPSGDVYYQVSADNLTGIEDQVTVPASEIIHDRWNCLFHPLVGLSAIFACGLAAVHGLKIQANSTKFFQNMSRPSGVLTAPGAIGDDTARRLKEHWEENFSGDNIGRVAVLGDNLKYEHMSVSAAEAQLVEQLKITSEIVCSTFHVPKHKVIGDPPSYNNIEALDQQYYSQCLQVLIEAVELCLDEGLDMPAHIGIEFDLDGLIRMDTKTQIEALSTAVKSGIYTPNAAMRKLNQKPVTGGDTVYLQQQMYSLEALSKRDAKDDPFSKSNSRAPASDPDTIQERDLTRLADLINKEFEGVRYGSS